MAKFCWMPLYTSDLVSSCVDMTPHQFGAYVRLLCYAWDNHGLPNDADACGRIAGGIDASDWRAIRRRLDIFDAGTDEERLSHPRLEAERQKQADLHDSRSEAGRRAAKKRWQSQCVGNADALTKPCHLEPEPEPEPELEPKVDTETDKKPNAAHSDAPSGPKRTRSKPADAICWDVSAGWIGIEHADRTAWAKAYPATNVDVELARADQWLKANPEKAHRSKWRRFITGWLSRCQDRGGTKGSQASAEPQQQVRRYYRGDANQRLSDAEYESWRRDKKQGGTVAALASSLKLKEEDL